MCIPRQTATQNIATQELALLRPQCYMDWSAIGYGEPDGVTFLPMLWGKDWSREIVANRLLSSKQGEVWLLANEPEFAQQANMSPKEVADMTWDFIDLAQATDSEFQWAAPGVAVNWDSTDGLLWMEEYVQIISRKKGLARPHYWHIHSYRSPSGRRFTEGWTAWVKWYEKWGRGAPVILSEVCAEAGDIEAQKNVIEQVNLLLASGAVHAALWFTAHVTHTGDWANAALTTSDAEGVVKLTPLGEYWLEATKEYRTTTFSSD